eukprot:jgi/Chlat1/8425/Chrsp80S07843
MEVCTTQGAQLAAWKLGPEGKPDGDSQPRRRRASQQSREVSSLQVYGSAPRDSELVCPCPRRPCAPQAGTGVPIMTSPAEIIKLGRRRSFNKAEHEVDAGREILDIFAAKFAQLEAVPFLSVYSESPPVCCTPPCRTNNPLIRDMRFTKDESSIRIQNAPITGIGFRTIADARTSPLCA